MEFVRSRKAQGAPSSASPARPPQGKSSAENVPLENVSRESDSTCDAVFSQKPQVEEMQEDGDEDVPPPPAVIGMIDSEQSPSFFLAFSFITVVCSSVFFLSYCNLAASTVKLMEPSLPIMKQTIKSGCFSSLSFITPAFISLLFSSPSQESILLIE